MPIISLEGNIGAGKSTLFNTLKGLHPEWYFIEEPVDQWMQPDENGESLLKLFYQDKRRWAYTFQVAALLSRAQAITEACTNPAQVFVTERSIEADRNVFANMLLSNKDMTPLEWSLYTKWYMQMKNTVPKISGYIHLDTPVTVCQERILYRAREGEVIQTDYLDRLDSYHFAWLRAADMKTPVMRFDNYSQPKDRTSIKDVEEFVKGLSPKIDNWVPVPRLM